MKEHFQIKETITTIQADDPYYIEVAKEAIKLHRSELESYILYDPYFKSTLEPYDTNGSYPDIVRRMMRAGKKLGIGPMSAVAGTISSLAVEAMKKEGAGFAIVDNGGDIAMINDRPVLIGIYAGDSPLKNIGFLMDTCDSITGICTSSGLIGPSISFGMADAAVVFCDDVSLADAAATALGNATGMGKQAVELSFDVIKDIEGIKGAIVMQGEYMGMWGEVPELQKADVRYECITKG